MCLILPLAHACSGSRISPAPVEPTSGPPIAPPPEAGPTVAGDLDAAAADGSEASFDHWRQIALRDQARLRDPRGLFVWREDERHAYADLDRVTGERFPGKRFAEVRAYSFAWADD